MVIPDNSKERGQGLVEYALIIVFVAVVVIVVVLLFGQQLFNTYCTTTETLFNATSPACP